MYIGSTDIRGLHHLVYEVVDNSIDEAMEGFCDWINVEIKKDGTVWVNDKGRGIPVEMHENYDKPALEVVMTQLHAGGKFESETYEISGGLHGVGVSVVNALSEWLEVHVHRNGKQYYQRFERGVPVTELEKRGETDKTGTSIHFKPDHDIFESLEFEEDRLVKKLRELSFLNDGVEINLNFEPDDNQHTFEYEDGITAFVEYLNEKYTPLHGDVLYMSDKQDDVQVECAIQYTSDSYNERIFSFANNINTHEGGTHETGFKNALTRTINEYIKASDVPNGDTVSGDVIREGITVVLSVLIPEPQFEGQTKTKLGNAEVRGVVREVVRDELKKYLERNPNVRDKITDHVLSAARARQAAQKAKKLTRRKSALNSTELPGKLADCGSRNPQEAELFIVEGDSAGGSAKQGRNRKNQAILPLKGKILNTEKARMDKILDNKEIRSIITALGTGIGEDEFDINELRYHKIIIMTDADVDGAHIRTLLLTFFFRYMPELIENGYVYIAQPPLYKVYKGSKSEYVYHENKLDEVVKDYNKPDVQRYKGLGEMNPDQLRSTTLDPENRVLYRVNIEDAVQADSLFTTLMGDNVKARRDFIQERAGQADNIDI